MNTIISLLSMQANARNAGEAKTVLRDAAGRIQSMKVMYDKLFAAETKGRISLKNYFPTLIEAIVGIFPQRESVKIITRLDDIFVSPGTLSPLGIIVHELITNAMKYAFSGRGDGVITVTASLKGNEAILHVEDNGSGIPESVTVENSPGFGLQLVGMLANQIDGSVSVQRRKGTRVTINFPI